MPLSFSERKAEEQERGSFASIRAAVLKTICAAKYPSCAIIWSDKTDSVKTDQTNALSTELESFLTTNASLLTYGYIVGGTNTVSDAVAEAIAEASGLAFND